MNFAVILAGGIGTRMGAHNLPKQYVEVNGKPVLIYTLEKFEKCQTVDRIIVVADTLWHDKITEWCREYGISKVCAYALPGETRQLSTVSGLVACEEQQSEPDDVVVIHDAARPMVSPALITEVINAAREYGGAMATVTAKDTIYCSEDGQFVTGLLNRASLRCGQTPEAFKLTTYLEQCRRINPEELARFNGCTEVAFKCGVNVCVVPGEEMNFKLTTQEDMDRLYTVLGIPREQHQ